MLNKKYIKRLHGQSVLEYVLLVGIISIVSFAMMQQIKRGTQSLIKVAADEIGNQANSDQAFSDNRQGYLDFSKTAVSSSSQKRVRDRVGVMTYVLDERQDVNTNSQTNLGFVEENK